MEKFYNATYDRYVFPTDNDLFEHMNVVTVEKRRKI